MVLRQSDGERNRVGFMRKLDLVVMALIFTDKLINSLRLRSNLVPV